MRSLLAVIFCLVLESACFARLEAAERTLAGALAKDGRWEVSIDFPAEVARASVVQVGNYSFPHADYISIQGIRYVPLDNAIILTVTGLVTNDLYSVKIENLYDLTGEPLPDVTESFSARAMSWVAVGGQELLYAYDAVSVGGSGFDLISGGSEMRDIYDESTFVFEKVEGNFDKKVRVNLQESSSAAARAGLMVRESLDEFRRRPADPTNPDEAFSRYLQVHVNPMFTALGPAANNQHEINIRYFTGGLGGTNLEATVSLAITNNAAPAYTNAWLRLRRVGDTFEAFRGDDGITWTSLGTMTFPTNEVSGAPIAKFPDIAYVGVNYAPEIGNIPASSGKRRAFMAQFREYGNLPSIVEPILSITRIGTAVRIDWEGEGTLQSNTNLNTRDWRDLPGGRPVAVPLEREKPQEYFRLRIQ